MWNFLYMYDKISVNDEILLTKFFIDDNLSVSTLSINSFLAFFDFLKALFICPCKVTKFRLIRWGKEFLVIAILFFYFNTSIDYLYHCFYRCYFLVFYCFAIQSKFLLFVISYFAIFWIFVCSSSKDKDSRTHSSIIFLYDIVSNFEIPSLGKLILQVCCKFRAVFTYNLLHPKYDCKTSRFSLSYISYRQTWYTYLSYTNDNYVV